MYVRRQMYVQGMKEYEPGGGSLYSGVGGCAVMYTGRLDLREWVTGMFSGRSAVCSGEGGSVLVRSVC